MVTRKKAKKSKEEDGKNRATAGGTSSSSSYFPYSLVAVISPLLIVGVVILAVGFERVRNEFTGGSSGGSGSRTDGDHSLPEVSIPRSVVDMSKWDPPDPQLQAFLNRVCQSDGSSGEGAYCHEALRLEGRVLRATRQIAKGETLMKIPRQLQIWDLDALRDPFIRQELIRASHKDTGNHLGSGAFLAAYIALQLEQRLRHKQSDDSECIVTEFIEPLDSLRLDYLETLPTAHDFIYHPILWNDALTSELLGSPSVALNVVHTYRNMVASEYMAFSETSSRFAGIVNQDRYVAARLNVLTRAFRTGPPGPEEEQSNAEAGGRSLEDELRGYREILHMDLEAGEGCHAMIPIADLLNHHPKFHVKARYEEAATAPLKDDNNDIENMDTNVTTKERLFVVQVLGRRVDAGSEPVISYGDMADAHLFGRYGFVVGDGSGLTQVSLAFHHEVLNLNVSDQYNYLPYSGMTQKLQSFQQSLLLRYLKFDDGYDHCIPGPASHPEEAELKRLKLVNLQQIANHRDRWVIYLPPRNPYALPEERLLPAPTFTREQVMETFNISAFQETCRFIAMINSDYDGKAMELLLENIETGEFHAPEGNDSLEFRALMCVARWVGTSALALTMKYGEVAKLMEQLRKLNIVDHGSRNWTAYHVRLGEMQGFLSIQSLVLQTVEKRFSDYKHNPPVDFTLRDDECPDDYIKYLKESDSITS